MLIRTTVPSPPTDHPRECADRHLAEIPTALLEGSSAAVGARRFEPTSVECPGLFRALMRAGRRRGAPNGHRTSSRYRAAVSWIRSARVIEESVSVPSRRDGGRDRLGAFFLIIASIDGPSLIRKG